MRDPRSLEPDFLLAFITTALERDDRTGGGLAAVIDAYQYDFSLPGSDGPSAPLQQRPERERSPVRSQAHQKPPTPRMVIGAPPSLARPAHSPSRGRPPYEQQRRPRSRSRTFKQPTPHSGKGRWEDSWANQDAGSRFTSPGNLTHGILHRLLKLVQRNQGCTPPKEIYNRWNTFCDANAPPPHEGGRPTRDPKILNKEIILDFMLQELPRPFWISLVKKVQAEGKKWGFQQKWTEYCDSFAPPLAGTPSRIRDPRNLDPEFLLSFVAAALEHDNPKDSKLASIVDAYHFDFTLPKSGRDARHSKKGGSKHENSGQEEESMQQAEMSDNEEESMQQGEVWDHDEELMQQRGDVSDQEELMQKGEGSEYEQELVQKGDSSGCDEGSMHEEDSERCSLEHDDNDEDSGNLNHDDSKSTPPLMHARIVKLLQQSSDLVNKRWNTHCDEKGTSSRDPDEQDLLFLQNFLCSAIPVSGWAEAVQRAVIAVPPLNDAFDSFMKEAAQAGASAGDPEHLLDFLCSSLEQCEEVAGVIGAAADGLTD